MKDILILDNYDSFTYNLVHLVRELGYSDLDVVRNDKITLEEVENYRRIILSPGPGIPEEAGMLLPIIKHFADKKPMLGICLGHQAICEALGGKLINLSEVHHGVASEIKIKGDEALFEGLGSKVTVGRYHSWVADPETMPEELEVSAISEEGEVMAVCHRSLPVRGLQFHPESVLTPKGKQMIGNWLKM